MEKKKYFVLRGLGHDFCDPGGVFSCGMDGTHPGDSKTSNNIGMHNVAMVLESRECGSLPHNAMQITGRAPDHRLPPAIGGGAASGVLNSKIRIDNATCDLRSIMS